MTANDVLDGAGENIDTADADHVVRAPQHASNQARPGAAARARLARKETQVPGSITNQRHSDSAEIRQNQLALTIRFYGKKRLRINDLGDEFVLIDV